MGTGREVIVAFGVRMDFVPCAVATVQAVVFAPTLDVTFEDVEIRQPFVVATIAVASAVVVVAAAGHSVQLEFVHP